MRGFIAIAAVLTLGFSSLAQGPDEYWIGLEEYAVHSEGELAGMTTWRMYLYMINPTDYLTSCSGVDAHPWVLESTTTPGWYNHPVASQTLATAINPVLFGAYPELEYDSWLTIGVDSDTESYYISKVEDPGYDAFDAFEAGENINSNLQIGNMWFTLFQGLEATDNPGFAGDDLKVLIGQITTAGQLSGTLYVQIFPEGDQENDLRLDLPIYYSPIQCNDPAACNYNEAAWLANDCVYGVSAGVISGETSVVVNEGTSEWTYTCDGEADSFMWDTGNGATIVSGQGSNTIVVDWGDQLVDPTQLTVVAVIGDDCYGEESMLTVDFVLGVGELDITSSLSAFPNPASSEVQINFDSEFNTGQVNCQLVSLTGQVVRNFVIENGKARLNVSDLASGSYIMSLQTDLGLVRESLIVQH
jgi:hypothetical protein